MGSKRDQADFASSDREDEDTQPTKKRQRGAPAQSKSRQQSGPQTDSTYGQRCVFPGLDEPTAPTDGDLEVEDEQDALAYLRSVRQEAIGIPHLLIAPKAGPQLPPPSSREQNGFHYDGEDDEDAIDRSVYENGTVDTRGYYADGAYTAYPDSVLSDADLDSDVDSALSANAASDPEAAIHEAYYAALLRQFASLRTRLHTAQPPPAVLAALPSNHPTLVGPFGPNTPTFGLWASHLRRTDPLPAQLAAMDKDSALRLLRVVLHGGKFVRRGCELRERTSRWLWALLARLPDRGELDSREVGVVRELGKRAVLMMASLGEMAALRGEGVELPEDGEETGDEGEDAVEEEEESDMEAEDGESDGEIAGEGEETDGLDVMLTDTAAAEREDDHAGKSYDDSADMEEGEVTDDDDPAASTQSDVAAARARLLARLEEGEITVAPTIEPASTPELARAVDKQEAASDAIRARINMRATLNMILTVAGELYGQRDLLEFRDPFRGM